MDLMNCDNENCCYYISGGYCSPNLEGFSPETCDEHYINYEVSGTGEEIDF